MPNETRNFYQQQLLYLDGQRDTINEICNFIQGFATCFSMMTQHRGALIIYNMLQDS